MATVTVRGDKTKFVNEFLTKNPQGNYKSINQAWAAAGMTGTISKPVVDRTRAKLGLTGNLNGKTRKTAKGKAVSSLPKASTRDQGKTTFVKKFLGSHPSGNVAAVNEAWTKAGKEGSIGATLIQKLRSQLGLSGNLRATSEPKTATKGKAAAKKSRTPPATPGKTMFVKEFLIDHPEGNFNGVNEAWTAAGFEGTISRTLVDKTRASLGLTGNLREIKKSETSAQEKAPYTGKKRGRKPKLTTSETKAPSMEVKTQSQESTRTTILLAVESEIDRLIFTIMGLGDLPEIETALRDARRRVCKATPT
jgi:hypothetical protein